ncbi:oligosaccharide flippase family protein [Endozoicomonas sp. G2_1]|nr:oligosaccharide flippase family protein [Endozoicomonas sp. G2_1]
MARILTPGDFALIAVVSIVLYFFDILSNSGSEQYVIQKTRLSPKDLNTAWTLDLLIKIAICVLLIVLGPLVVTWLEKPEIATGLQCASLVLVFNALKQPRLMMLKRQLNYQFLFRLNLAQKLLAFTSVLSLAYVLKSFWAFVIADLVAAVFLCLVSYICLPKAPRLTLINVQLQWQFSKWLLGKNILGYLRSQIDTLFVSKFFSNQLLGNYHMAREVAMLPAHHFLAPAIEPLLASFKDNKHNKPELAQQFNKALLVLSLIASPICVFIMFYGDLIVTVLLGEQWQSAGSLLAIFSLLFVYWVYLLLLEALLTALGKVRLLFILDLISLLVIFATLYFSITFSVNINNLAAVRALTGIVITVLTVIICIGLINATLIKVFTTIIWPVIPSLIAAYIISAFDVLASSAFLLLLLKGTVYCLVFGFLSLMQLMLKRENEDYRFVLKLLNVKI